MTAPVIGANTTYMSELAKHYKRILELKMGSTGKDLFDCVITGGTLYPSFKDMGDGMIVCRFEYTAVFMFEGLPAGLMDPRILMAATTCWLLENDKDRGTLKLPPPKIDVEAYENDNSTPMSDMEITIQFSEPVMMKEVSDGSGDIFYNNKSWSIQPYVIHIAESTRVIPGEH